jgi:adenine-specific DNA methylase
MDPTDLRLIEAGFPCHHVGVETRRERDTGKQPPTARLHVWWARRPLTPSRAAIPASLLPADADPQAFVKELGIRVLVADVQGVEWVLGEDKLRERVINAAGKTSLTVDVVVQRALTQERAIRGENRQHIDNVLSKDAPLKDHPALLAWQ